MICIVMRRAVEEVREAELSLRLLAWTFGCEKLWSGLGLTTSGTSSSYRRCEARKTGEITKSITVSFLVRVVCCGATWVVWWLVRVVWIQVSWSPVIVAWVAVGLDLGEWERVHRRAQARVTDGTRDHAACSVSQATKKAASTSSKSVFGAWSSELALLWLVIVLVVISWEVRHSEWWMLVWRVSRDTWGVWTRASRHVRSKSCATTAKSIPFVLCSFILAYWCQMVGCHFVMKSTSLLQLHLLSCLRKATNNRCGATKSIGLWLCLRLLLLGDSADLVEITAEDCCVWDVLCRL